MIWRALALLLFAGALIGFGLGEPDPVAAALGGFFLALGLIDLIEARP